MPDLAATQKAVAGLALQRPDLLSLARLASVAAVVEPSLLRRLRKEAGHVARVATTHLEDAWDAGLEADLWFSSLAHVVTADQLTLRADVLEILRSQLAGPTHKVEAEAARRVVSDAHQRHPKMVRLEERIIWSTLTGDTDDVGAALRRALATLKLQPRAAEVIRWFMQARRRLPPAALQHEEGRRLAAAVAMHLDRVIPPELLAANRFPDVVADLAPASLPPTFVGVQITTGGIRFVPASDPDAADVVKLPAPRPLVVEVTWEVAGRGEQVALVRADEGSATPLDSLMDSAVVRTISGSRFRVVATRSRRVFVAVFGEVRGWSELDEVAISAHLTEALLNPDATVQLVRDPTGASIRPEVLVVGDVGKEVARSAFVDLLPRFASAAERARDRAGSGADTPAAAVVVLTTAGSDIRELVVDSLAAAAVPVRTGEPDDRVQLVVDALREVLAHPLRLYPLDEDTEPPVVRRVKTVNPPPMVAPRYFEDQELETGLIGDFLREDGQRWLTVLGRGGIGKTAMVCRLLKSLEAGRLPNGGGELAVDGIVYLSPTSQHHIAFPNLFADLIRLLPPKTAEALQERYRDPSQTPGQLMAALLDEFPGGRTIVMLDGLEDLIDSATGALTDPVLDEAARRLLLGAQHAVKVIATSRLLPRDLVLSGVARHQRLDLDAGLPTAEAITVLRHLDPTGEFGLKDAPEELLATAAELTRGLPRALEAVAAILAAGEADLPELLTRAQDVVPDRIVEVLVADAYSQLDPLAQQVMQVLAIFHGPVPPVAVDLLLQPFQPFSRGPTRCCVTLRRPRHGQVLQLISRVVVLVAGSRVDACHERRSGCGHSR